MPTANGQMCSGVLVCVQTQSSTVWKNDFGILWDYKSLSAQKFEVNGTVNLLTLNQGKQYSYAKVSIVNKCTSIC